MGLPVATVTATVTTMRTAGRSVPTVGTTVGTGMMGLLALRESLMNGVAVAADDGRPSSGERWAQAVQRRPWIVAATP